MLQIEGQMLHRVILSLLGIQYVLMDSAHTVPPISGMASVYPLYLSMHQDNLVSVGHMSSCCTYLQIEGQIIHRVTLSLVCIHHILIDSAHISN